MSTSDGHLVNAVGRKRLVPARLLYFGNGVGAVGHIGKPIIAVTVSDSLPGKGIRQKIEITGSATIGTSHEGHNPRDGIDCNDVLTKPVDITPCGVEGPVARPRPKSYQLLIAQLHRVCESTVGHYFGDKASHTS